MVSSGLPPCATREVLNSRACGQSMAPQFAVVGGPLGLWKATDEVWPNRGRNVFDAQDIECPQHTAEEPARNCKRARQSVKPPARLQRMRTIVFRSSTNVVFRRVLYAECLFHKRCVSSFLAIIDMIAVDLDVRTFTPSVCMKVAAKVEVAGPLRE